MVTTNASNEPTAASGKVLQGQGVGTASNFSTATYPSTAGTSGKVLVSDGTNIVSSTPTFPNASASSGKFIRSDGTNWIASTPTLPTSAGTSGKILQSDGTNYVESTATFPSTATGTGTILRADGTNWVATTSTYPNTNAVSTLLYASSANVMSALATANSGVLSTSSSGVPSIDTTNFHVLTTGVQLKGNNTNTAPPAGFIGEQISSAATNVATTSTTAKSITSIALTAGIWDISAIATSVATGGTATMSTQILGISATDNTLTGNIGDDQFQTTVVTQVNVISSCVPNKRATLSGNTTYYAVVDNIYTSTTCPTNARITATRVG